MNIEIGYLWSHKCPKKWDQYTLVALVITIIILLILAGISIAQLTGNGLFEKAKTAKEESKNAQDDENDEIAKYTNEIDSYLTGNRNFPNISYSTEEQDTGLKWLDRKPIYQKTIVKTNVETGDTTIDVSSLKIEQCIDVDGCHDGSSQNDMNDYVDYRYAIFSWYNKSTDALYIRNNSSKCDNVYITILYTKKANTTAE